MSKNAVLSTIAVIVLGAAGYLIYKSMGSDSRLDRNGHVDLLRSKGDDELKALRVEWASQIEFHVARGEDDRAESAQHNLDALDQLLVERGIDPESIDPSTVKRAAAPTDK